MGQSVKYGAVHGKNLKNQVSEQKKRRKKFCRARQHKQPDWTYVGSKVNAVTGSRRTETYNTNLTGTTKLRDGSIYLDPTVINFRRWKFRRLEKKPVWAFI